MRTGSGASRWVRSRMGSQNVKLCVDVDVIRTETTVQCANISSLKEKNKID